MFAIVIKLSNDKLKMEEGKSILKRLKPGERLILLDEGGMQMTSVKFANWIETGMSLNGRDICFVIGGAYGFSSEVYEKAEMKISLSKMTFSHQIISCDILRTTISRFQHHSE